MEKRGFDLHDLILSFFSFSSLFLSCGDMVRSVTFFFFGLGLGDGDIIGLGLGLDPCDGLGDGLFVFGLGDGDGDGLCDGLGLGLFVLGLGDGDGDGLLLPGLGDGLGLLLPALGDGDVTGLGDLPPCIGDGDITFPQFDVFLAGDGDVFRANGLFPRWLAEIMFVGFVDLLISSRRPNVLYMLMSVFFGVISPYPDIFRPLKIGLVDSDLSEINGF